MLEGFPKYGVLTCLLFYVYVSAPQKEAVMSVKG